VSEGQADGYRRADQDSNEAAAPRGRAQGIAEADSSDASARGQKDGAARGDADALAQAQADDYPRGRKDYYDTRFAESPQSRGEVLQKAAPASSKVASLLSNSALTQMFADIGFGPGGHGGPGVPAGNANPDYRYLRFKKTFPSAEENQAYADGAREGYAEGFRGGYSSAFEMSYKQAYGNGNRRGCDEARRRDYRADFERGARDGRERGYREAYDRAYRDQSRVAYDREFSPASNQTYRDNYDSLYKKHFEEARTAAYSARVNQLYSAAFDNARAAKYQEMYPRYAQSEYQRGQKDEAQDFAQRPVRITGIEATETIVNNVFEPGEALRAHIQVRNFANSEIRPQDLSLQIKARSPELSVVTVKAESLAKSLAPRSVTEIREALEFLANEQAAGRSVKFDVALVYQGKVIDTTTLEVRPNFALQVQLAETPSLKEGLPMPVRAKVTNISNKALNGVVLKVKTDADQIEVAQPTLNVGTIAAGETKVLEYTAIGRNVTSSGALQMGFIATEGGSVTGRRIGLLDLSRQFPVVNDYFIDLANASVSALRAPGVVRLNYTVRNQSRRLMYNSLQVKVRFLNTEDASNFVVIGPNPQFLMPLDRGESVKFTIPVMVKAASKGGVVEVEVQEAGVPVVIHREDFSQGQSLN
jgi:hypothetical protein